MKKLVTALMLLVATTSISFAANQKPTHKLPANVDSQTTSSTNQSAFLPRYLIGKDNTQQPENQMGGRPDWVGH